MKISYLDFEKPISELESQTEKLKETHEKNKNLDISKELTQLELKTEKLLHEIYDNLNAWQISQVSRHPQRPYTLDYIEKLFEDFEELHGDRAFADDPAIVGGFASFEGMPVMVIGHQKGRDVSLVSCRGHPRSYHPLSVPDIPVPPRERIPGKVHP